MQIAGYVRKVTTAIDKKYCERRELKIRFLSGKCYGGGITCESPGLSLSLKGSKGTMNAFTTNSRR